ncbi:hypothetical protein [Persicobacter diffluens]|uniref:Uncharacterized protein n=1 Tax=Persicobacter diffluens TaxID=981 RepID=A0AAN4VVY4_9BACT|nr:hypothetical protein PEDI_16310 [Persicobacter diffluens]
MSEREFEAFLKEAEGDFSTTENWEDRLVLWQDKLQVLRADIHQWLAKYVEAGSIVISEEEKTLIEEGLGSYTVKGLRLEFGHHIISITPVGTRLIGSVGRVDVIGPKATQRLLLVDKTASEPNIATYITPNGEVEVFEATGQYFVKVDWAWKLATRPPEVKYTHLDANAFFDILMKVVNG